MDKEYIVKVTIKSEAIFGSGKSNGLIHEDGKYDEYGFTYYGGKTLKGMFRQTAEKIKKIVPNNKSLHEIINSFFAEDNFTENTNLENTVSNESSILRFSDLKFCSNIRNDLQKIYSKNDVLKLTTNIRNNITIENGVTKLNSLRSTRTLKADMELYATITAINDELTPKEESVLKLIIENTRYLGKNTTKGRGLVEIKIDNINKTLEECYKEVFNEDIQN